MQNEPAVFDPRDACPKNQSRLRDWLKVQDLLAWHPCEAVRRLRKSSDPRVVAQAPLERDPMRPEELERAVELLQVGEAVLLPLPSAAYPPRLARLEDAAPVLAVRGDWRVLGEPCVAIVGARAATVYGLEVAENLARELAGAGVVVVSGLAYGIDAAAHRGALAAGGRTVAIQACGLDMVYPRAHTVLAQEIAENGAIVCEFPPGTQPLPHHFPLRNRLIAALSNAVVVVEGRRRSGSLSTARHALDHGTEVLAVPGPLHAPTSEGPNRLLWSGARPALDLETVLDEAGLSHLNPQTRARKPQPPPEAKAILAALAREPATRDELARRMARSVESLALQLLELELSGWIVEDRDGRLRRAASTPRGEQ